MYPPARMQSWQMKGDRDHLVTLSCHPGGDEPASCWGVDPKHTTTPVLRLPLERLAVPEKNSRSAVETPQNDGWEKIPPPKHGRPCWYLCLNFRDIFNPQMMKYSPYQFGNRIASINGKLMVDAILRETWRHWLPCLGP